MADRSVVYRLKADVTQFRAQMASAAASVQAAGDKMTAADRGGATFRKGLSTLGATAGKVGLVAAVGLGAAIVKAANFDQAMSKVAAATHESAGNMALLRTAAIQAGQSTVFSATESADAITAMAKAGVSANDILSGGLKGALSLASAGELDVASAADIAATAMNQFGLAGKDIPHIADLLAAGAGKAQGEVTDFAEALKFVGPVAHQMGISIEETTGTIAELATQGILGEQAGTGLRGMLLSLSSPSSIAAKTMDSLGISVYDAQGQFVGFNGIAAQLHESMSGLTAAERDQAFGRIFGNAQVTTARILYAGGAQAVDKWTNSVNDSGYAAETAKIKLNNLKGDLEQLSGSLETALIGTGDGSQGMLRGLVQGLTNVVNAYNKLPHSAKSATAATLGFTAAAGGGIYIFSKIISGVAGTREAMQQLGLTSGKTGAALSKVGRAATIAGAALAGLAIIDAIQSGFNHAGPGIEAVTKSLLSLNTASALPKNLDGISESIDRLANPNRAQALQDNISDALGGIGGGSQLKDARAQIEALDGALTNLVSSAGPEAAANALSSLADTAGLSKSELGDLKSLLPGYSEALTGAGNSAKIAAGGQGALGSAASKSAGGLGQNAAAAQKVAAAQAAAHKAVLATANSFVGLGKDVNNSKVSLNGWIHQLSNMASSLNHFADNAVKAANRGLRQGLIKELQKAGPEGAMRMKQLADGTSSQIGRANRAWASQQRAVARYTATVEGVPNSHTTTLKLNGAQAAIAAARALNAAVAAINPFKSVTIQTKRTHIGDPMATGGYVSGPGGPRDDRIPAMLSNGEFVVNAAATARNLGLLHEINRKRYADGGLVQRFADGGQARHKGGGDSPALTALHGHIHRLNLALDRATKSLDKEKQARDDLVSKRKDLATSTSGNFASQLFGTAPDNLSFMNPAQRQAALTGSVFSTLKSDIANANTFKSALSSLASRGLKGQAFADLAASGDVNRAQAFSGLSVKDLGSYQTLFNQRAAAAASVGSLAGNTVFGAQISAQTKAMTATAAEVRGLRADLKRDNRRKSHIHVHDKSGNPHKTAKEVSRRQAMG